MDKEDCIKVITDGMDNLSDSKYVEERDPLYIGLKEMSQILGYHLMDWEYEYIVKYIKAFREDKKIICTRGSQKTNIPVTAVFLDGILPEKVIFDEFICRGGEDG